MLHLLSVPVRHMVRMGESTGVYSLLSGRIFFFLFLGGRRVGSLQSYWIGISWGRRQYTFLKWHNCSQIKVCSHISYYVHIMVWFISYCCLKLADRLEHIYQSRTGIGAYALSHAHLPQTLPNTYLWQLTSGKEPGHLIKNMIRIEASRIYLWPSAEKS